jgi:hypothetical protein
MAGKGSGKTVLRKEWMSVPSASSAVQPYIFSAPLFQDNIVPSIDREMIASVLTSKS